MTPEPLNAIAAHVEVILPNPAIRERQLWAFAESLDHIHGSRPFMWLTHVLHDRIRLFSGRLIVLTLQKDFVWLATDAAADKSRLSGLESWEWDTIAYPEYKRPPSRNGFYRPARDSHEDWLSIRSQHFDYLDRLLVKERRPDPRSVAKHEPRFVTYISQAIGRPLAESELPRLPQEVPSSEHYYEGAVTQITVNRFERDPAAREACLRHFGYRCAACDMSFGDRYGTQVERLIEVHHKVPLSEIRGQYIVDPINDLVPLCPNCHAVLHRLGDGATVDDVKQMLRASASP